MKNIKKSMLLSLLIISLGGQADNNIEDKVNCAANVIVFQKLFRDKDNPNILPQKARVAHWTDAITKKLVEIGTDPVKAESIVQDAVNTSLEEVKSQDKEAFDKWWVETIGCIKKYSNNKDEVSK